MRKKLLRGVLIAFGAVLQCRRPSTQPFPPDEDTRLEGCRGIISHSEVSG
jgi:hypothetical protein